MKITIGELRRLIREATGVEWSTDSEGNPVAGTKGTLPSSSHIGKIKDVVIEFLPRENKLEWEAKPYFEKQFTTTAKTLNNLTGKNGEGGLVSDTNNILLAMASRIDNTVIGKSEKDPGNEKYIPLRNDMVKKLKTAQNKISAFLVARDEVVESLNDVIQNISDSKQ